jgi:Fe2+ transport system protein FeoA
MPIAPPKAAEAAGTASDPVRLSALAPGQVVRLHCANLAAHDCALLGALGLTDSCLLRICKIGEPCIVQVHATRIGLSRSVADGIFVVPQGAG